MKIGILGHGFVAWNGGVDFLKYIVMCILASDRRRCHDLVVLVPCQDPATPPAFFADFVRDFGPEVHVQAIDQSGPALMAALKMFAIDVLAPSMSALPPTVGVPWLGYMYDFQHRYLGHLFSEQDRSQRDMSFLQMVSTADTVIVNSKSVAVDIARFYPAARATIVSLPFSAAPNEDWFEPSPDVAIRYGIETDYFIISNQFWVHKNHFAAFTAFAKIAVDHPGIALVCTGPTSDYRMPDYFKMLQDGLVSLGIAHRVHILGHIPKADQIALLQGALAVVQPTMFEGGPGGGSVSEAVALGVPSLVSNIPVNMELTDSTVSFFDVRNEESLADLMRETLRRPKMERASRAALIAAGHERRRACGNVLIEATEALVARASAQPVPRVANA